MVAPVNKNVQARVSLSHNPTDLGSISELPGRENAPAQVGPGLRDCLRTVLAQHKISPYNIETFFRKCTALTRYNSAFRKLFDLLQKHMVDHREASLPEIAQALLELH